MSTFAVTVGGVKRTVTEIATGTGLSLTHVSQLFSGKKQPSMASARKIAGLLGVTIDRLDNILRETAGIKRWRGQPTHWRDREGVKPTLPAA